MVNDSVLQILYYTSFVLFFFFGILQLTFRNKLQLNYALAALFFVGGYEFFCFWGYGSTHIRFIAFLANSEISNSYLIGPAFYIYFCLALGFKNRIRKTDMLHLLPFGLSIAGLLLFNMLYPNETVIRYGLQDYSGHPVLFSLAILSDISVGIYILITFIRALRLFKGETPGPELKLLLVFLSLMIVSSAILISGGLIDSIFLTIFGIGCFTALPSLYILFSFRHPEFSMRVLTEAKQLQKNKSVLRNLDVDLLLSEMNRLMEEDHIFRQETLSLQSLSGQLKITAHQLSRLLNEYAGCSFRTYINSYRVAEAKRMLCERPDMGVLEISLAVGFNSKSSFYTAFQKETGCIPAEFRKKPCPEL